MKANHTLDISARGNVRFHLASLPLPVIQAPMAGGPSTPELPVGSS